MSFAKPLYCRYEYRRNKYWSVLTVIDTDERAELVCCNSHGYENEKSILGYLANKSRKQGEAIRASEDVEKRHVKQDRDER